MTDFFSFSSLLRRKKRIRKQLIPLEQSMPWNPGKQWHTPELHSPLPWQLRGHSCTESVKKMKWDRERERRGVRQCDGKHQSLPLNHWHNSFFKILQIESKRCRVSQSHRHQTPSSKIPWVSFLSAFFIMWQECIMNQPFWWDGIHQCSAHRKQEYPPPLSFFLFDPFLSMAHFLTPHSCPAPPRSLIFHQAADVWCS